MKGCKYSRIIFMEIVYNGQRWESRLTSETLRISKSCVLSMRWDGGGRVVSWVWPLMYKISIQGAFSSSQCKNKYFGNTLFSHLWWKIISFKIFMKIIRIFHLGYILKSSQVKDMLSPCCTYKLNPVWNSGQYPGPRGTYLTATEIENRTIIQPQLVKDRVTTGQLFISAGCNYNTFSRPEEQTENILWKWSQYHWSPGKENRVGVQHL